MPNQRPSHPNDPRRAASRRAARKAAQRRRALLTGVCCFAMLAVVSLGPIGAVAADAIALAEEQARREGRRLSVAHYDLRFLTPLDEELLLDVGRRFRRVVTVEDGVLKGGMGSALLEFFADHGLSPEVVRLGLPDHFVEHGSVAELQAIVGLDKTSIAKHRV